MKYGSWQGRLLLLLAPALLAGCADVAWLEELPASQRVAGPPLDGLWLLGGSAVLRLTSDDGLSGCRSLQATTLTDSDLTDASLRVCYYDVQGTLLMELRDEGFFPTYQHAFLEATDSGFRFCWTWDWIDAARGSGQVELPAIERDGDILVTASGPAMFAFYLEHGAAILKHCHEEKDGWISLDGPLPSAWP